MLNNWKAIFLAPPPHKKDKFWGFILFRLTFSFLFSSYYILFYQSWEGAMSKRKAGGAGGDYFAVGQVHLALSGLVGGFK